jgi:nitroimidazol reductase NimA-like FMN-containing flavoprotein (pyridoxamine 5'-phosphate oxidase superfamily)
MVIHEMTEQECRAMLTGMRVARLACARDNQPYIVPVHLDFDGEHLYGYATLGMKIEWMRQNPLVCLQLDDQTPEGQWASVIVFGHYEELPDTSDHQGSRRVAERLFQQHPMWWEPATVPIKAQGQRPPIVYRIRIGRVTGRRSVRDGGPERAPTRQRSWVGETLRRLVGRPVA